MAEQETWREIFDGGSPAAERETFRALARAMTDIQEATRRRAGFSRPMRTLHAKMTVGIEDARLVIDADAPARYCAGHLAAGAAIPAIVRFSNASAIGQPDGAPDMRGAALRLAVPGGGIHDLLMTSFPVSHARNARQFVDFATIVSAGDRPTLVQRLVAHFGESEAKRMLANIQAGARPSPGLHRERFWSRGAFLWGDAGPVRFQLHPVAAAADGASDDFPGNLPGDLNADFAAELARGDVAFRLAVQPFVDEAVTPIEDGSVEWTEAASPPLDIGTLIVPRRAAIDAEAAARVDALAFNPWNAPPEFRPLGNLNRARGAVYGASAARWQATGDGPAAAG